jgi:hypothetical protein
MPIEALAMVMMNTGCRQMRDPPADRRKQGKPQPIEPLEVPDGLGPDTIYRLYEKNEGKSIFG